MVDYDLSNEELEDWVSEAMEILRNKVRVERVSPEDARAQLSGTRNWRTQGEIGLHVLSEACDRFRRSIEGATYKKSKAVALTGNNKIDREWYDGPDLTNDIYWPPVGQQVCEELGDESYKDIDATSSNIVAYAGRPLLPKQRTKGLVVGHVQSGKTTNFLSVIAKGADEGYRLIIVLTGMTDSLRMQTQKRLDKSLVEHTAHRWTLLTTDEKDFEEEKNEAKLSNPDERLLAVVKKNAQRLKRLNEWIDNAGDAAKGCPILVIDDEADQASINVANSKKAKEKRSRINAEIGNLVRRDRTSYIAYTATPFANVLIDPNDASDLYPKDFIVGLPAPKGYFGAEQLFGRESLFGEDQEDPFEPAVDAIRIIPEEDVTAIRPVGTDIASWQPAFSNSLREAILWFVMATSARWNRNQRGQHSSMLIHSSWLTQAHDEVEASVKRGLANIRRDLVAGSLRNDLESLWNRETNRAPLSLPVDFESVLALLPEVLGELQLHVDNGKSDNRVDFDKSAGQTIIAIGGNTLSRGITLEGLNTSYFVRTSKTYDTLLQMGRWFGFRQGYEDLVRIYMPRKLIDWYTELSTIEADFRRDIERYEQQDLTPLEAKTRIRTSEVMQVTSSTKMQKTQTTSLSFSEKRVQTLLFKETEKQWLDSNINSVRSLVAEMREAGLEPKERNGTWVFHDVESTSILDFLHDYKFADDAIFGKGKQDLLIKYIEKEVETNGLRGWNISIFGQEHKRKGLGEPIDLGLPKHVNLVSRSKYATSRQGRARIQGLVGSVDRIHDLRVDDETRREILNQVSQADKGEAESVLIRAHERFAGKGIGHLALYAISRHSKPRDSQASAVTRKASSSDNPHQKTSMEAVQHIIGAGFFMPPSPSADGVEYISGIDFKDLPEDEQIEINEMSEDIEGLSEEGEMSE